MEVEDPQGEAELTRMGTGQGGTRRGGWVGGVKSRDGTKWDRRGCENESNTKNSQGWKKTQIIELKNRAQYKNGICIYRTGNQGSLTFNRYFDPIPIGAFRP